MNNGVSLPESTDAVWKPFVNLWAEYVNGTNHQCQQWFEAMSNQADSQAWRRRWVEAMADSMEAYMRSPAFLEAMKRNMEMVIHSKDQMDNISKEFARNAGIPTTADISGLFERLHGFEEKILQHLEHIERRLDALEQPRPDQTVVVESPA